ncbi:DUF3551 domain-containing protein [Bradyrhizobium sp. 38]|uniref:DUF3551 domain-containing protein n=1 Tax=unclassified Bradyrhizobium TaxID=2631580 RepID=UPI001FF88D61|nr:MULTISPECIES: DUF3551 domain-containing protein [unclassified Bradyrhizobium]MCK1340364.1 DUF3551 domain-containing protein [Bradyrhizobium sp. 38]MCK1781287.1 DUF3551 domain-containing protein [Bradyrhizobium sp. 132]
MRNLLYIAVLALPMLVCFGSPSTAAPRGRSYIPPARQDVYCLQGRTWGYPGNCQFSTYDQCTATASGTLAYCGMNPIYAFQRQAGQSR